MKPAKKTTVAMDSESDYGCCGCGESETESETMPSVSEDVARAAQERWEDLADHAEYACSFERLEALDIVMPCLPDGPQARVLEQALLNSKDLPMTLMAVGEAARAMARATELVRHV